MLITLFNGVNHCLAALGQAGVPVSTPHSFVFVRLASEAFYCLAELGQAVV